MQCSEKYLGGLICSEKCLVGGGLIFSEKCLVGGGLICSEKCLGDGGLIFSVVRSVWGVGG